MVINILLFINVMQINIENINGGIDVKISHKRIKNSSSLLKKAAILPINIPSNEFNTQHMLPIANDVLIPINVRVNKSLPKSSVPNKNVLFGNIFFLNVFISFFLVGAINKGTMIKRININILQEKNLFLTMSFLY